MTNFRMERIRSAVLEEIGRLLVHEEIRDPRVNSLVLVRDVDVSKDLQHAKVHISGYISARKLDRAVEGLNHAAGFIQSKLARRLKMKSTPRLHFLADHSIEQGFEITERLREVSREDHDVSGAHPDRDEPDRDEPDRYDPDRDDPDRDDPDRDGVDRAGGVPGSQDGPDASDPGDEAGLSGA